MLKVHSLESLGTFDGPGIRLVIFLQGCNFACSYCANVDTIPVEGGKERKVEELVAQAVNQRPFFGKKGGVTISGGEPLLQSKGLIPLFKRLHEEGINTCLDTNGSVLTEASKELMEHTDLVLLDIKHIKEDIHREITGTDNSKTLAFAKYLREINKPVWLRYVLVPSLSNADEDLHTLGEYFKDYDNIQKIEIQPYHSLGVHKYEHLGLQYQLEHIKENTLEQLEKARSIYSQYFKEVIVN